MVAGVVASFVHAVRRLVIDLLCLDVLDFRVHVLLHLDEVLGFH